MTIDRPVPQLRGEEAAFFEAAAQGKLVYQQCGACGHRESYPRVLCSRCFSADLQQQESAGLGIVYSFTTLHRAGNPAFRDEVPYTVALVDLREGTRVLGDLELSAGVEPTVGLPVEVFFEPLGDLAIPRFRNLEHGQEHA